LHCAGSKSSSIKNRWIIDFIGMLFARRPKEVATKERNANYIITKYN